MPTSKPVPVTSRPRGHASRVRSYGSTSPAQGEEYLGVAAVGAASGSCGLGRYDLADLLGRGRVRYGVAGLGPGVSGRGRWRSSSSFRRPKPASAVVKERFLRELPAAHLRHPGIVAVHDVGEERGCAVHCLGSGARQSRRSAVGGAPRPRRGGGAVVDVADALDYAHRRGVVHRDVKPSNILLEGAQSGGAAGRPRLTDWAALREAGEVTMTVDGQLLGTPAYMSPEQARRPHAVDGRSDVYSLGVILYEPLTGQLLLDGTLGLLHQVAVGEPVPPSRLNSRVPRDLEAVCLTCLAKGPTSGIRRPACWRPTCAAAGRRAGPGPAAGRVARLWLWAKRNPALAGTGALGAVAFVAVAGAPVAGALVAATTAALLFALHRAKVAADLSRQVEGILQDQKRAAAAVRFALRHCAQARQQRDRAAAAEARATGQARAAGQFAREVIFDLPDLLPTGRKHRAARAYLARAALAYLDRLAAGAEGDAVLLRDLALAYAQVGDTLEAESPAACPAALACHVKALRIFTPLAGSRPNNTQAQRDLAACRRRVAELDRKARSGGLSPFSVSAGERKTECTNRE
ncbi:MAG: serine/threonine-protein kinase [Gemmataceae bacterium]